MAFLQVSYESKTLNGMTNFSAFIPIDTYEDSTQMKSEKPMKTLYLLHGYTGGQLDWACKARVQGLAQEQNLAIIMPDGHNSFYLDDEDKRELFGEYVGNELVEYTRDLFPLSHKREDTIIGGLSMGGFGALRNGLKYSENFGQILALSSALIIDNIIDISPGFTDDIADYSYYTRVFGDLKQLKDGDKDPEYLIKKMKKNRRPIPDIYMACGTEDFLLKENRRFHEFLVNKNIKHEYVEGPGEHNWDFWDEYIKKGIEFCLS